MKNNILNNSKIGALETIVLKRSEGKIKIQVQIS